MVDYIFPKKDILQLYRKQKAEFNFHHRSDDDFIVFLLDTATRVLSIAHQLTPVLESVSVASDFECQPMDTDFDSHTHTMETREIKSTAEPTSAASTVPTPQHHVCHGPAANTSVLKPPLQTPQQQQQQQQQQQPSDQDDEINQLAREIESVANSLLEVANPTHPHSIDSEEYHLPEEEREPNENIDTAQLENVQDDVNKNQTKSLYNMSLSGRYSMLGMSNISSDDSKLFESHPSSISVQLQHPDSSTLSQTNKLPANASEQTTGVLVTLVDPKNHRHTLVKSKQRRCKICHKIRRWSCSICDVGVCQKECFFRFHEKFSDYQFYVEKFKCFGKNHRARLTGPSAYRLPQNWKLLNSLNNIAQSIPPSLGFKSGSMLMPSSNILTSTTTTSQADITLPGMNAHPGLLLNQGASMQRGLDTRQYDFGEFTHVSHRSHIDIANLLSPSIIKSELSEAPAPLVLLPPASGPVCSVVSTAASAADNCEPQLYFK